MNVQQRIKVSWKYFNEVDSNDIPGGKINKLNNDLVNFSDNKNNGRSDIFCSSFVLFTARYCRPTGTLRVSLPCSSRRLTLFLQTIPFASIPESANISLLKQLNDNLNNLHLISGQGFFGAAGQICLNIYFLFYSFLYFFIALP